MADIAHVHDMLGVERAMHSKIATVSLQVPASQRVELIARRPGNYVYRIISDESGICKDVSGRQDR